VPIVRLDQDDTLLVQARAVLPGVGLATSGNKRKQCAFFVLTRRSGQRNLKNKRANLSIHSLFAKPLSPTALSTGGAVPDNWILS
jgi:hypothetical protein